MSTDAIAASTEKTPTPPVARTAAPDLTGSTAPDSHRPAAPTPTGPAAAALVSAGIGCLVLGVCVLLVHASKTFHDLMIFTDAVGPLGGKSTVASIAYLVSWPLLHLRLRGRHVDFGRVLTWSITLVAIGLLLTFPPFYTQFGGLLP